MMTDLETDLAAEIGRVSDDMHETYVYRHELAEALAPWVRERLASAYCMGTGFDLEEALNEE